MRTVLNTLLLEPGTGKAIELLAGQILRIEQVEGGQCVDFNAFKPVRQAAKEVMAALKALPMGWRVQGN